jgi:hypothetical protein
VLDTHFSVSRSATTFDAANPVAPLTSTDGEAANTWHGCSSIMTSCSKS